MQLTMWAGLVLLVTVASAAAQPEQVHASWLGDGMVGISWARPGDVTTTSTDIVKIQGPNGIEVQPESLAYIAPGITVHKARVPAPAGTGTVSYTVGSEADGWSAPFTLQPPTGEPFRVVAYGDMGTGATSNASAALPAAVLAKQPQAVLHLGDITYADGDPPVWDDWFRLIEPLAAQTFYMTTPGNHEHEGNYVASGPSEDQAAFAAAALDPYEQYRERFFMPGDGADLSYSVDIGPLHLVSLNSEDLCVTQPATYMLPWRVSPACGLESANLPEDQWRSLPPNQALLDWLDADLAANVDAAWTIVMLHRPVYSAGGYNGEQVLREYFVPVFERHGVDLVLSGHDHNYQRSHPLRDGQPVATNASVLERGLAPVYIVSGGGGEGYYALDEPSPAWAAAGAEAFHFLLLDFWSEGLRGQVIETMTGETLDEFTIGSVPTDAGASKGVPGRASPFSALVILVPFAALAVWRRCR